MEARVEKQDRDAAIDPAEQVGEHHPAAADADRQGRAREPLQGPGDDPRRRGPLELGRELPHFGRAWDRRPDGRECCTSDCTVRPFCPSRPQRDRARFSCVFRKAGPMRVALDQLVVLLLASGRRRATVSAPDGASTPSGTTTAMDQTAANVHKDNGITVPGALSTYSPERGLRNVGPVTNRLVDGAELTLRVDRVPGLEVLETTLKSCASSVKACSASVTHTRS